MSFLLILFWRSIVSGRCGEWLNSRFHGFHSRLTRRREFPRKGVELPRGFWRRMAVARVKAKKFPFNREWRATLSRAAVASDSRRRVRSEYGSGGSGRVRASAATRG